MSDEKQGVTAQAQEEIIDLSAYIQVVNQYKWRILFLAIMVTLLVGVITYSMTPVYRASASMLIEAEEAKAVSIEDIYGLDSSRQEYFSTQFEILKSQRLAGKVVDALDLANEPEFMPDEEPGLMDQAKAFIKSYLPTDSATEASAEDEAYRARQLLIAAFMSRLSISPVRKTQLVKISFEAEDPKLAAKVVNTLGEIYIRSHLEDKMGMTQKANEWLRERLDELTVSLKTTEAKLQTFRETNGLVDIQGVVALTSQELNEITSQLSVARQKRTQAQAVMRLLDVTGKTNISRLMSMPEISGHQLIQDIKRDENAAQSVVAELSKRYGPKHNKMISANARLDEVQTALKQRISALVEGIEQEYQSALATEQSLKAELEMVKLRFQKISKLEAEHRVLLRDVKTNQELYDTFLTRIKETGAVGNFQAAHARFTDLAQVPLTPAKPNKVLIVVIAFVGTLFLGVILAFVLDSLSNTISSAKDVEQFLAQRVIGMVPQYEKKGYKELPVHSFFEKDAHKYSEAWRTLRTGYVLSHIDAPAKVVAITSTIPGEGKTTTATNLCFSLSQVEKVLLIEADMRRPTLGNRFGIPNYQPGLSNLITGTHQLEDCIYSDKTSGMDILVAGSMVTNPLELLTGDSFKTLIKELSEQYDRVVIDTPPAHVVSDAMVISKVADSYLYVVRADHVRRESIQQAMAKLQSYKARIDGVVLNRISDKANESYYGYKYDGYYTYDRPAEPKASNNKPEAAA